MIKPFISIVSPVYGAEQIVHELVNQIVENISSITDDYEIILVDDCGPDESWQRIEESCQKNRHVKGIKLSKNFGQHYAVSAGIQYSKGDNIIIMDCDLQDDPKSISSILDKINDGYDVVFTKRKKRSHTFFKNLMSYLYNLLIGIIGDKKYDINVGSMLGASRKACEAYLSLKEKDRLYVQMFKWIGFSQYYLEVPHNPRFNGKSTYSFLKMLSLAIQGITSHSTKLLKLSIYLGFSIAFFSFLSGLTIIILYFTKDFSAGWPSLIVTIAFATGLILISNGVSGIYIGKIFEQVKDRPLYIIHKKLNFENE
jgi:glycosyltransferase involved in cell wall biosynthesis